MKYFIFGIKDRQVDAFLGQPLFMRSVGEAERWFRDNVNRPDEQNMLYLHPEDHELYQCGSIQMDTMEWSIGAPVLLLTGAAAKRPDNVTPISAKVN